MGPITALSKEVSLAERVTEVDKAEVRVVFYSTFPGRSIKDGLERNRTVSGPS
jgi:hypothetical protein